MFEEAKIIYGDGIMPEFGDRVVVLRSVSIFDEETVEYDRDTLFAAATLQFPPDEIE